MEIPRVPPTNLLKSGFAKVLALLAFCKIHMLGASQKCYVFCSSQLYGNP